MGLAPANQRSRVAVTTISSNSKNTKQRGDGKSLGAVATRSGACFLCAVSELCYSGAHGEWVGGDGHEGSAAARGKWVENKAASQREPKAVTQNLRARPRRHCRPQKWPCAPTPATIQLPSSQGAVCHSAPSGTL